MDFLLAEQQRKSALLSTAASAVGGEVGDGSNKKKKKRKFIRNKDLRKFEEDEEIKAEEAKRGGAEKKEEKKEEKKQKKRKLDDEATSSSTDNTEEATEARKRSSSISLSSLSSIDDREISRRLRLLSQPIRLFAETEDARRRRLYDGLSNRADDDDKAVFANEGGAAVRNVFLPGGGGGDDDTVKKEKKEQKYKTVEDIDFSTLDEHELVYSFFKTLLKEWERKLASRSPSERSTSQGKKDTLTQKQCADYIRPLFKLCKARQLDATMTTNICEIVKHAREGEFVKANDAYINIAVGNAAWPIGVTQVGIHSRGGREKIGENKTAHVMNSELSRKYLTSVKRLMSYYQGRRTDVAPSKKVVY